jgi:transposase
MDRDSLAALLGRGLSVEAIAKRFDRHPSTVSYWMAKHGLEAVRRDRHAARGGIERDELERMVKAGLTIAQIADTLGVSKGTVRHWLGRYGLKTANARGRRPAELAAEAKQAGKLTVMMACARHGETEFLLEGRGYYRCKRCRAEAVARRRRKMKQILVTEAGGRCCICGYERSVAALEFHHIDPAQKRLPVSARGIAYSLETLRVEAAKCVLLCSNCHAEVESGVTALPVK